LIVYICNVKIINLSKIASWYAHHKESELSGRYLPFDKIAPLLEKKKANFKISKLGESYNSTPIYKIRVGNGPLQILIWTQMHGNESTGTKAVFDLLRFFETTHEHEELKELLLEQCTITMIPMLNPDGAKAYTRVNAQERDLNRDVIDLKAPESNLLMNVLQEVNPSYCFNLHDQRTIFTVGDTRQSATISFLAPSVDESRQLTAGRKETMRIIVAMNTLLQQVIPGQIGRYTDEFYPTATGDNFQKMGHNTVLIEAGHCQDDYQREQVRYYNFLALLQGLISIAQKDSPSYKPYFEIPNNTKYHLDIIYTNVFIEDEQQEVSVGVLFKEVLKNGSIAFEPTIDRIGDLEQFTANTFIDAKGIRVVDRKSVKKIIKK